jgi:hypothetical protein
MAANVLPPLSAASIIKAIASSLPKEGEIKSPYDAIALAVHACMLNSGFRLIGLDEEESWDSVTIYSLPLSWNAFQSFTFRYAASTTTPEAIVKVSRLGKNAVIDAISLGDNKRTSFDVPVEEYTDASSLPTNPLVDDASPLVGAVLRNIQQIYISAGRLGDFADLVKTHILQKLQDNPQDKQQEESAESAAGPSRTEEPRPPQPQVPQPANPYPTPDNPPQPSAPSSSRPRVPAPGEEPPGFEDEYDIYRPPGRLPGQQPRGGPDRNPLSIGADDLYPPGLGPNDPIRPHLGPGGLREPGSGGGMHPRFDDPLFGEQGQEGPQANVPPGARYDPTYPGDPQGELGQWPGTGRRGPGAGGQGGFSGFGGFPRGDFI